MRYGTGITYMHVLASLVLPSPCAQRPALPVGTVGAYRYNNAIGALSGTCTMYALYVRRLVDLHVLQYMY